MTTSRAEYLSSSAVLSDDGLYRYRLLRRWSNDDAPHLPFIMLNPSTADGEDDDPTIRRCVGFAKREGFGGLAVYNLYAYRATDPKALWRTPHDIVGPDNDRRLRNLLSWATAAEVPVVAAWGANAKVYRVSQVVTMDGADVALHHLGLTKAGAPKHPLYLAADTPLTRWAR